jgi:hypothetical protein
MYAEDQEGAYKILSNTFARERLFLDSIPEFIHHIFILTFAWKKRYGYRYIVCVFRLPK